MTATFVLDQASPKFPVGTVVKAYPGHEQAVRDAEPPGAVQATATVQSDGSLTFTGLAYDTAYWAAALVASDWAWTFFRTPGGEEESSLTSRVDALESTRATSAAPAFTGTATFGGDANLYRSAADTLKTDDTFIVGGGSLGVPTGFVNLYNQASATDSAFLSKVAADTQQRFVILVDGKQSWGPGGSTSPDTNLYRSAADTLKTDDAFKAVADVTARDGAATKVVLGAVSSNAGVLFGSSGDANLYRTGAGALKTDGTFSAVGAAYGAAGTADQVQIGVSGGGGRITFGSAEDTNLYRRTSNTLKTDDSFEVGGAITVTNGVVIGDSLTVGSNVILGSDGTDLLGFYGDPGTTKPNVVGSRGANAALTSLLNVLSLMGLIQDDSV